MTCVILRKISSVKPDDGHSFLQRSHFDVIVPLRKLVVEVTWHFANDQFREICWCHPHETGCRHHPRETGCWCHHYEVGCCCHPRKTLLAGVILVKLVADFFLVKRCLLTSSSRNTACQCALREELISRISQTCRFLVKPQVSRKRPLFFFVFLFQLSQSTNFY